MLSYPQDLIYTNSHEYIRLEGEVATIGITAFAIEQLGDIVFVDLPQEGTTLVKGDSFGTVESVKAVEDIYAPISGEVLSVNSDLIDAPETMVEDPYGKAWFIKVKIQDANQLKSELDAGMSAAEYLSKVEGH